MNSPFRATGVAALLLMMAAPARADEASDRRDCAMEGLATQQAACTRLIATPGMSAADLAVFYGLRGTVSLDDNSYADAIADLTEALARDPNALTLRRRGEAEIGAEDYAAARRDLEASLVLDPNDYWTHNRLGLARHLAGEDELALLAYNRALELNPNSPSTYELRGDLHRFHARYAEAIADTTAAMGLVQSLNAGLYAERASASYSSGNLAGALRDYRVVNLVDPNDDLALFRLEELAPERELPSDLPALEYAVPAAGLTVTYIETIGAEQRTIDPMEEAIFALVGFFASPDIAEPESASRKRYTVGTTSDGVTLAAGVDVYDDRDRATIEYAYSLLQSGLTLPNLPRIGIDYVGGAQTIWRLLPGGETAGTAVMAIDCPATVNTITRLLGCLPGLATAQVGQIVWSARFEGWEDTVVPVGRLLTARIGYSETTTITLLGQTIRRNNRVTWWIDPEIDWWVRRVRIERPVADELGKVQTLEAEIIAQP